MSFIYDNPWLVEQLLKPALEEEKKRLEKQAQTDPAELAKQNAVALQQQIKALQDQIKPSPQSEAQQATRTNKVGTQADGAALKTIDLQNLGSLVSFVTRNKMTVGGNRIAYGSDEQAPQDESYHLYKLEGNATLIPVREEALGNEAKQAYRINKDLLVKYIQSLQAQNTQKPNPVMKIMLQSVIEEANQQMQANVGAYKEPEKTLPDTTAVDSTVPQLLDPKKWGATGAGILTAKDIKSVRTLNDWMRQTQVTTAGGDGQPAKIDDQDFNLCAAIQTLYLRAQSFVQRAGEKSVDQANFYLHQIEAIAGQAQCNLSQVGGAGQAQQGTGGRLSGEVLQELASELPFNSQYINFQQITKFIDKYAALANNANITSAADQVHKAIDMANGVLATPGLTIQLNNTTTERFRLLAKNANQGKILANYLYTLISVAGRIYQDFITSYEKTLGADGARPLRQQLSPGGPQQSNISILSKMMQLL